MQKLVVIVAALVLGACGNPVAELAANCTAQAGAIHLAAINIAKMQVGERAAVDGEIAVSKGYCSGTVPADPAAANKVVLGSTAQIGAIVAIAKVR